MAVGDYLLALKEALHGAVSLTKSFFDAILPLFPCWSFPPYFFFLAGFVGFLLMLYGLFLRNQGNRLFFLPYLVGALLILSISLPYLAGTSKEFWYVCKDRVFYSPQRSVLTGRGQKVPPKEFKLYLAGDTLYEVGERVSQKGALFLARRENLRECWLCHLPVFRDSLTLELSGVSFGAKKVAPKSKWDGRFVPCKDELFVVSVKRFPAVEVLLDDRQFLQKTVCSCKGKQECVRKAFEKRLGKAVELKVSRL